MDFDKKQAEALASLRDELANTKEQMAKQLAERDEQMAKQLAERDEQMAKRDEQMAKQLAERDEQMAKQLAERDEQMAKQLAERDEQMAKQLAKRDEKVAKTYFPSFLNLCHREYFPKFQIEERSSRLATGKFTNVDGKYYPQCLSKWTAFNDLHNECQTRLGEAFGEKRIFPSSNNMEFAAATYRPRFPAASEQDIADFENVAVETWVMVSLVEYLTILRSSEMEEDRQISENAAPSRHPNSLLFRSYAFGITADPSMDDDDRPAYVSAMNQAVLQELEGHGKPPRKKQRSSAATQGQSSSVTQGSSAAPRKFYPDKWLMRSDDDGSVSPILVMEYKAAHKLRAQSVQLALENADNLLATAIRQEASSKITSNKDQKIVEDASTATARVLVQAFHYMIEYGLCYSYVTSGETMVLLSIDPDDPRTLYYHFCAPGQDVPSPRTETSSSSGDSDTGTAQTTGTAAVQHTAVALALTMALLALDAPTMTQRWKRKQQAVLQLWPTPYANMSFSSESQDSRYGNGDSDDDDSGDHVPGKTNQAMQASLSGRTYATRGSASRHGDGRNASGGGSAGGGGQTSRASQTRQYCTQACLLGLRNNGSLDAHCPNYGLHALHARTRTPGAAGNKAAELVHGLSMGQFAEMMRAQLADDLDEDCEALDKFGKFGAIGMLFRLTLRGYGYCVTAKGVQRRHMALLKHELAVYEHVQTKQGDLVPVCLGLLELVVPYWTSTGAHVSHLLLLSYGGEPLTTNTMKKTSVAMPDDVEDQAWEAWRQLQDLGVNHGDQRAPNVLWNVERQRVMCIDFDRAEAMARPISKALARMSTSSNTGRKRKRKRTGREGLKESEASTDD